MFYTILNDLPVGSLLLAGDADGLRHLLFQKPDSLAIPDRWEPATHQLKESVRQVKAYFSGRLRKFELLLKPEGTPFQLRVWKALQEIPWGATASYGEIAAAIGQPTASRAVGMANGRNPIAIIIPCHRIVGSSGHLVGFGGGLPIKRTLLELEGSLASGNQRVTCPE
ncbi:MAG: methylated-DNA--[protein]-cysteine S-methyltransferase [Planctomycetaceae bacterium]|nr:methylated-DNA--[protein]-cysteine S-methyltransferase [Planctomycetaceae bacterium]